MPRKYCRYKTKKKWFFVYCFWTCTYITAGVWFWYLVIVNKQLYSILLCSFLCAQKFAQIRHKLTKADMSISYFKWRRLNQSKILLLEIHFWKTAINFAFICCFLLRFLLLQNSFEHTKKLLKFHKFVQFLLSKSIPS